MDILTKDLQITPAVIKELLEIERDSKKLEARKKELTTAISREMKKHKLPQILQDGLALFYIRDAHIRTTFDSKTLQMFSKRLYNQFLKTSKVSESLTVKWEFDSKTLSIDEVIESINIPKEQD